MRVLAWTRAVIVHAPRLSPCIESWRVPDSKRWCRHPLVVRTPGAMDPPPVLAVQTFARNALNRSTLDRRDDQFLHKVRSVQCHRPGTAPQTVRLGIGLHHHHADAPVQALPDAKFVLVSGTAVLVRSGAAQQPPKLLWHDTAELRNVGVDLADDHFVIHGMRWSITRCTCEPQQHSVQHGVGRLLRVAHAVWPGLQSCALRGLQSSSNATPDMLVMFMALRSCIPAR